MRVVIAHHGHCFDGMASAAFLTRVLRARYDRPLEVTYRGLDHQAGGSFVPPDVLTGEVNAVVDFRYTTSPRLDWYFDHHQTGIVGEIERAHLAADQSGQKFFDASYGSCCKLVADVARARFGFEGPDLAELVERADVIDAARFPDATSAVDLDSPAMKLMTVIEVYGDDAFLGPRIRRLADGEPLASVADDHAIKRRLAVLVERQRETRRAIEERARCEGGVVSFDLTDLRRDRYNKFLPYLLFPDGRYAVAVMASPARAKVSVGSNPWARTERTHDIAALCARYGGGGHAAVGAVSLPADQNRASPSGSRGDRRGPAELTDRAPSAAQCRRRVGRQPWPSSQKRIAQFFHCDSRTRLHNSARSSSMSTRDPSVARPPSS